MQAKHALIKLTTLGAAGLAVVNAGCEQKQEPIITRPVQVSSSPTIAPQAQLHQATQSIDDLIKAELQKCGVTITGPGNNTMLQEAFLDPLKLAAHQFINEQNSQLLKGIKEPDVKPEYKDFVTSYSRSHNKNYETAKALTLVKMMSQLDPNNFNKETAEIVAKEIVEHGYDLNKTWERIEELIQINDRNAQKEQADLIKAALEMPMNKRLAATVPVSHSGLF